VLSRIGLVAQRLRKLWRRERESFWACAEGKANKVVARQVRLTQQTVSKWRSRFVSKGLDGLLDEFRPGTPRKISDEQVEKALVTTLESLPQDATHWSTRSLAEQCGLSRSTVSRIWRAFGLQPHRFETSSCPKTRCSSRRSGTGLYLNPPDRALGTVVVHDEMDFHVAARAFDRIEKLAGIRCCDAADAVTNYLSRSRHRGSKQGDVVP